MALIWDGRASNGFAKSGTTFTNGALTYNMSQEVSRPGAFSVVPDPLGQFGAVFRMDLDVSLDYSGGTDKARCELQTPTTGAHADNGAELWLNWRFMIPDGFQFASGTSQSRGVCVILQVHDHPGGVDRAAPWHWWILDDWLEFRCSYEGVGSANYERLLYREKCRTNHWYSVVLNVLWENTTPASGIHNVWLDRRKVWSRNELTCYATNDTSNYPKASGIYYGLGVPDGITQNTVYQQGVIVADDTSSTFDEFMAECGSSDTELEGFVTRGVSL